MYVCLCFDCHMSTLQSEPPPLEDDSPPSLVEVEGSGEPPSTKPVEDDSAQNSEFPIDSLTRLDEQLGRPKWVVPVRPGDDLEKLLVAAIRLCREGQLS